jgi:hypothetical protein
VLPPPEPVVVVPVLQSDDGICCAHSAPLAVTQVPDPL